MSFLSKIFGDANERYLANIGHFVTEINDLEPEMEKLSSDGIKAKTAEFKERLTKGETLDDILPEAFALAREASKRTLGQRHFDVQLFGGYCFASGKNRGDENRRRENFGCHLADIFKRAGRKRSSRDYRE